VNKPVLSAVSSVALLFYSTVSIPSGIRMLYADRDASEYVFPALISSTSGAKLMELDMLKM